MTWIGIYNLLQICKYIKNKRNIITFNKGYIYE